MSLIGRLRLPLVCLAGLLALAWVTVAAASPLTSATGRFSYETFSPSIRLVGGNTIIDYTLTALWMGTFSGTSVAHGTLIIHADGSTDNHGSDTFTGTVNGVSGTVTFNEAGPGDSTSFQNTDIIISRTGNLANLQLAAVAPSAVLSCVVPVSTPAQAQSGQVAGIYYKDDLIAEPMRFVDGAIELPEGAGMGIAADEAKIRRYRVGQKR